MARLRNLRRRSFARVRRQRRLIAALVQEAAATSSTPAAVFETYREPGFTDPTKGGEAPPYATPIGYLWQSELYDGELVTYDGEPIFYLERIAA